MKLLISKNNKSRFTMDYKLIQDDEKFDQNQFIQYGVNARQCKYANVVLENGKFEYQAHLHFGIICQLATDVSNKTIKNPIKNIFQVQNNKIINRILFDSNMNIENGVLIAKAVFACDKQVTDIDAMKRKFETSLRVEILSKLQTQIQELLIIKSDMEM